MPRKIRDLVRDLKKAGFSLRPGKSGHRNFVHSKGLRVTISGRDGDDAKPYQEQEVKHAVKEAQS